MTGWPVVALGDLCSIELGATPPRGSSRYWDKDKSTSNVWLSIADLPTMLHAVATDSKEYLSDEGAALGRVVTEGTLLVSFKLTLGRLAYAGCDLRTNEAIAALPIKDAKRIEKKFLYWYLTYFDWQKAAEGEDKVKGKTLNKAKLKVLPVLVPPFEEQRRIVAVLDRAFTAIATATSNAEKNLANARELFNLALNAEIESGFPEVPMKELCSFENGDRGENYAGRSAFVDKGIPIINAGHLIDGKIDTRSMNFITRARASLLRGGKVKRGDILFCLRGSLGKFAYNDIYDEGAIASSLIIIRPGERILPEYLCAYLESGLCSRMISHYKNGAAQPNLGGKSLEKFRVPLPPLREQPGIIGRLGKVREAVRELETLYDRHLSELDALKQSLLRRAFAGELTAREVTVPAPCNDNFATPDFAAAVIAFAYRRHESQGHEKKFGHVKAQKALHFCESIAGIDLGRQPIKDAAGPNDFPHMRLAEKWAKEHQFFEFVERDGGGYEFRKLSSYQRMMDAAIASLKGLESRLTKAIDPIVPMRKEEAEVFATVHAAWNNLILEKAEITDTDIVHAARDKWHRDKLNIPERKFHEAINFIRKKSLQPDGSAKRVGGQEKLPL